eukprot:jgi/Chlat1/7608/Chrsp64S07158
MRRTLRQVLSMRALVAAGFAVVNRPALLSAHLAAVAPRRAPTAPSHRSLHVQCTPSSRRIQHLSANASAAPKVDSKSASTAITGMGKIQFYGWGTPNGHKIGIALKELGVDYETHFINIGKGDQNSEEYIKINPNSKIPSIVDPEGPDGGPITVFESGAILIYLAEKYGKLLGSTGTSRMAAIQWTFFQNAGVGPMMGQFAHFAMFAKDKCQDPYPTERYAGEVKRLLGVLEKQLSDKPYIAGEEYTIADITTYPWVSSLFTRFPPAIREQLGATDLPNLQAWVERVGERNAVKEGIAATTPPPA